MLQETNNFDVHMALYHKTYRKKHPLFNKNKILKWTVTIYLLVGSSLIVYGIYKNILKG